MIDKINVTLLAGSAIGMNQSGMKSQIDAIEKYFINHSEVNVYKYDIWNYQNPKVVHFFGFAEGMKDHLDFMKKKGVKLICSPNHWPTNNLIIEKFLLNFNIKNIIHSNRSTKKYLLDNSDCFIVNSDNEKKMFVDIYDLDPNKIKVVYNSYGDEPIHYSDAFLKKYNISKPYCLMVGMIGAERKNQLRVLKIWNDRFPNLFILGNILETNYGKECLQLINSKSNITFLGFESDFEILESSYQNAELVISPGLIETPSLVALRALLYGTTVCSTNGGNVPFEYFEDNVYYFNPFNEKEILKSIENGLSKKKLVDKMYLKRFSNESIMSNYTNIYKSI